MQGLRTPQWPFARIPRKAAKVPNSSGAWTLFHRCHRCLPLESTGEEGGIVPRTRTG